MGISNQRVGIKNFELPTNFATVCANVEYGLTWNTGKESLPSFIPRVESITEMKWIHVLSNRGAELDFVKSCFLSARIHNQELFTYLDIRSRDIAYDVLLVVNDGQRRNTFSVHKSECFLQRLVSAC